MNTYKNAIHMLKSVTNIQMNSFVITTADGKLMVIDGGQRPNAEYLLEYLRDLTGEVVPHVDAWFLTHAHNDHVDAFLEILQNHPGAVTFDKVYMNFPSEQFFLRGKGPDKSAAGTAKEVFDALPLFADKLCIATEGDLYEIGEAKIEVLYTTHPDIIFNICNNSSLVFKMTLGGKTALFLADCGEEAGNIMLEKYKGTDTLDCDICQMAHHGQNGVTRAFYEEVKPEICFWCAPDWLWNNDAGKGFDTHCFNTVKTRGWMEALGVKKNYVLMDGTQICQL